MAKCCEGEEAVETYKKTLESVPEEKVEQKAVVLYNLALAQIRQGALDPAIAHLNDVLKMKGVRVAKKAMSLKVRLKQAREKGLEFKLKSSDAGANAEAQAQAAAADPAAEEATKLSSEADYKRMLAFVDAKRGDLCCYMIFNNPDQADARATSLLAKPPRFTKREQIERAEAMQVERKASA
jgi:ATP/maltotriose-dependent transcriptional regulator MalT